jgi:hypothetical protein
MLCFYSLFISLTPWVEKDGLGSTLQGVLPLETPRAPSESRRPQKNALLKSEISWLD